MTTIDYIKKAYDVTDHMSVSGGAIEQMAALRQALRDAYRAAAEQENDSRSEGEGVDQG